MKGKTMKALNNNILTYLMIYIILYALLIEPIIDPVLNPYYLNYIKNAYLMFCIEALLVLISFFMIVKVTLFIYKLIPANSTKSERNEHNCE